MPRRVLLLAALALAGCTSTPATPAPAPAPPSPAPAVASPVPPNVGLEVRRVGLFCNPGPRCYARYEVKPQVYGAGGVLIGQVWRISYEMTGVELPVSGEVLIGDSSGRLPQEVVLMASKDAKVGAEVTGIELVKQ